MKFTMLGTSAGLPTPDRGLPAVLFEMEGEFVLFDCGEGTQRQMMSAGFSLGRKMRIFITHLHGDHIFGLPGMIHTMNLLHRVNPLEVYGPPGLKEFLEDTTVSTMSEPSFKLSVSEVSQGRIYCGRNYHVDGVWADHSRPSMAYRLVVGETPGHIVPDKMHSLGIPNGRLWRDLKEGRSVIIGGRTVEPSEVLREPSCGKIVVYSGDTKPSPAVEALASGADILIHEATFLSDREEIADREGHSTARGAALVALRAGAKKLLLTHISARYPNAGDVLDEAKAIFPGAEVAEDLGVYEL
jgi:ribonuclease Z